MEGPEYLITRELVPDLDQKDLTEILSLEASAPPRKFEDAPKT